MLGQHLSLVVVCHLLYPYLLWRLIWLLPLLCISATLFGSLGHNLFKLRWPNHSDNSHSIILVFESAFILGNFLRWLLVNDDSLAKQLDLVILDALG